jgi:hypothetical protein
MTENELLQLKDGDFVKIIKDCINYVFKKGEIHRINGIKILPDGKTYVYKNITPKKEDPTNCMVFSADEIEKHPSKVMSVRAACQARQPLDGTDALHLEHALQITERERDEWKKRAESAEYALAPYLCPECKTCLSPKEIGHTMCRKCAEKSAKEEESVLADLTKMEKSE